MHELVQLARENALGTFVLLIATVWAIERAVTAWANSKRPIVKCECDGSCCEEE